MVYFRANRPSSFAQPLWLHPTPEAACSPCVHLTPCVHTVQGRVLHAPARECNTWALCSWSGPVGCAALCVLPLMCVAPFCVRRALGCGRERRVTGSLCVTEGTLTCWSRQGRYAVGLPSTGKHPHASQSFGQDRTIAVPLLPYHKVMRFLVRRTTGCIVWCCHPAMASSQNCRLATGQG